MEDKENYPTHIWDFNVVTPNMGKMMMAIDAFSVTRAGILDSMHWYLFFYTLAEASLLMFKFASFRPLIAKYTTF